MNRREKVLLMVTGVFVVGGLGLAFMPDDLFETMTGGLRGGVTGQEVRMARQKAVEIIETLTKGRQIQAEYKAMAGDAPVNTPQGQRPGEQFSNELYTLLITQGFQTPPLEYPKQSPIENVDDYYSVDIKVQVTNKLTNLTRLLKEMERRGIMIKTLRLDRRNGRVPDEVTLDVTVARLVKHDDASRKRLKVRRSS